MDSIGSGALMLMQYDQLVGSSAMALWASVLLLQARGVASKEPIIARLALKGVVSMILTGPLGYAVACIWARDELIFGNEVEESKKTE